MNSPSGKQQGVSVEVRGLRRTLGGQQVLKGLDFHVRPGEVFVLMGPSGSGKTVLLKHLIGLEAPDAGEILVEGQPIQSPEVMSQYRMAMVFQSSALLNSLTVGENVAFPLREHTTMKEKEIRETVADRLRSVGLTGVEEKMPSELSGGMRKRVGLARAIALRPQIVLFDEPTTGLDPVMTEAINRLIIDTQKNLNLTCVVISHDIRSIFEIGHRIAMLYEGKIIENGTPEELKISRNPVIVQFLAGSIEGPIRIM
jgi:phospholipid/cholesterol/gamma-HCH transport system ATP-binding protein